MYNQNLQEFVFRSVQKNSVLRVAAVWTGVTY